MFVLGESSNEYFICAMLYQTRALNFNLRFPSFIEFLSSIETRLYVVSLTNGNVKHPFIIIILDKFVVGAICSVVSVLRQKNWLFFA